MQGAGATPSGKMVLGNLQTIETFLEMMENNGQYMTICKLMMENSGKIMERIANRCIFRRGPAAAISMQHSGCWIRGLQGFTWYIVGIVGDEKCSASFWIISGPRCTASLQRRQSWRRGTRWEHGFRTWEVAQTGIHWKNMEKLKF